MKSNPPNADAAHRPLRIPPVESARHDEALLDQAVAETFPASDPISPAVAARLEPGDSRRDELSPSGARLSERFARLSPAAIGIGTAVIAWIVLRALSNRRSGDGPYEER